jgi:hypothetical protein
MEESLGWNKGWKRTGGTILWPPFSRGGHRSLRAMVSALRAMVSALCLSYRDLEEVMAARGVDVDHSTIAHWVAFER